MNPLESAHKLHVLLGTEVEEAMRQKLETLNPGYKRTYPVGFREMLNKATTVGEVVSAYQKLASSYGAHDNIGELGWQKILLAKECKVQLIVPAVG